MLVWNTLLKTLKDTLVWGLLIFCMGYIWFLQENKQNIEPYVIEKVVEKPVIHETIQRETITEVQVKEKEKPTDPDVVVDTKDDVKVSLNGKQVSLTPTKGEEFNFEKDYIELRQNSSYNINIKNEPLEPSWGVGVGYTTNGKVAGMATARIKETPLHVWGMSDGQTSAVGIMFSTNYK